MIRFELEDHGPRPGGKWCVFGLQLEQDRLEVDSLEAVAAGNVTHVAIVRAEMASLFDEASPRLLSEIPAGKRGAIVLVMLRPCPWPEAASDGRVYSFLATV